MVTFGTMMLRVVLAAQFVAAQIVISEVRTLPKNRQPKTRLRTVANHRDEAASSAP